MSFYQRAKTPKNGKDKFLTEYQDHYNTFNKTNLSSFRDKIKKKAYNSPYNNYMPNSYKYTTFMKSSAPFNYYNNMNDRNGLLVCYNGGPRKEFRPIITRDNLAQILRNRSNSFKYRKPCGCYSNFYCSKYTPEYEYPNYERRDNYNTYHRENKETNLPYIYDNENLRHSHDFMSPQMGLRKNEKITYKLKGNLDEEKNRINTDSNACECNQNKNPEIEEQEKKEEIHEEKKEEINEEEKKEKIENNNRKNLNCFNLRPRRRFHKVQIFNNCKPFLVDDFKEYGYYE